MSTFQLFNLCNSRIFFLTKIQIQLIAVTIFVYISSRDGNVTKEIREDILKSLKTTFHRTLTLSFTVDTFFVLICSISPCKKKKTNRCGRQDPYNASEIPTTILSALQNRRHGCLCFLFFCSFMCVPL